MKTSKHWKITALFLLTSLVCIPSARAGSAADTLKILHISDTHVCFLADYHPAFVKARQHYADNAQDLRDFFRTIPEKLKAEEVIVTGDLVDFYEAEAADGTMLSGQIERLYPLFQECPVRLLATLGNHDLTSYSVNEEDSSIVQTQTNAEAARANWIRKIPCFQDGTYYSTDVQVSNRKIRFLFLDNGYYLRNGRWIDKPQLDWLNAQVHSAKGIPVILFMHIFLPVGDTNGDGVFFKKREGTWPSWAACTRGLLKLLDRSGNIKAIFVGHGHRNITEWIRFPSGHKVLQCETGSLGDDARNWRLLLFTADKLIICKPGSWQKEESVDLTGGGNR